MNRTAFLLACLVAFGSGNVAEAMPAAQLPSIQHADVLLQHARVVCKKHGRCYRARRDRDVYFYPSYQVYRRYYQFYPSYSHDPWSDYDRWGYYSDHYWGHDWDDDWSVHDWD